MTVSQPIGIAITAHAIRNLSHLRHCQRSVDHARVAAPANIPAGFTDAPISAEAQRQPE